MVDNFNQTFKFMKLIILQGLPASGKTTWSAEYITDDTDEGRDAVVVNRDKIREMLKIDYDMFPFGNKKFENLVTKLEDNAIIECLNNKLDVIVDATNLRGIERFEEIVANHYYHDQITIKVVDHFLEVPVEECIERDLNREYSIGEEIIEGMAKKYNLL